MADPREEVALVRHLVTLGTVVGIFTGWVAVAVGDAREPDASSAAMQSLPPLPELEPEGPGQAALPSERPQPVATTRSSR